MSNKKTYIELNGVRYDAHTGKILGSSEPEKSPADILETSSMPVAPPGHGVIDGFVRQHTENFSANTTTHKTNRHAAKRQPAAHTSKHLHSSTQKSKTLMRPGVTKPQLTQPHATKKSEHIRDYKPTALLPLDHRARLERAKKIKKSNIISRFYTGTVSSAFTKHVESIPVAAPPKSHTHATQTTAASVAAHPASHISKSLEHAIEGATSHLNSHHIKTKKPKRMTIVSSTLAVVLLTGFFAYQNVPDVQMRVAASRAGFSAGLPGYSPSGFGIAGPIEAEPGKVVISFKSRTDNKFFQVKQQVSEWSPATLLSNYARDKSELRTYPDDRGRTLYIYGGSNVTWVDAGVWYDIAGNASLSDDQLLRIANSL